jgi:hypothetical protein
MKIRLASLFLPSCPFAYSVFLLFQIKNFLLRNKREQASTYQPKPLKELLANPPPGYVPPPNLAHLFTAPSSSSASVSSSASSGNTGSDILVKRQTKNNFLVLIGLAAGYQFPQSSSSASFSAHNINDINNLSSFIDAEIMKMKDHLSSIINNPSSSYHPAFGSSSSTASKGMMISSIPGVPTLTNPFMLPPNVMIDEAAALRPSGVSSSLPIFPPPSATAALATSSQIIASQVACEASGVRPSTSSSSSFTSVSLSDPSAEILRNKAHSVKDRAQQAKLLLEYYQTCKFLHSFHIFSPFNLSFSSFLSFNRWL